VRRLLPALITLWAVAAPAVARPLAQAAADPAALLQAIDDKGAEAVLQQVYDDDPRWQQVLDGIATGSRGWLSVAERLKRVARIQAEELTVAVGRALEREPANALAILGGAFDADDVCSLNTLEQSLGPDYAMALRSVERRERAVAAVTAPAVREQRDLCLGFLRELKREVIRNKTTWFQAAR
jgi:hypothetical protein